MLFKRLIFTKSFKVKVQNQLLIMSRLTLISLVVSFNLFGQFEKIDTTNHSIIQGKRLNNQVVVLTQNMNSFNAQLFCYVENTNSIDSIEIDIKKYVLEIGTFNDTTIVISLEKKNRKSQNRCNRFFELWIFDEKFVQIDKRKLIRINEGYYCRDKQSNCLCSQ